MRPDHEKTIVDFANEYPDYLWLCAYIEALSVNVPEVFLMPPTESSIEQLAELLSTKNYAGAYLMGGDLFLRMIQAELEREGRFEECAEILATLETQSRYCEPIHDKLRQTQGGEPLVD